MLDISSFTRPQWDIELLTKMGASSVSIDTTVGPRIYAEEDEFYIPVPMFLVKAIKQNSYYARQHKTHSMNYIMSGFSLYEAYNLSF